MKGRNFFKKKSFWIISVLGLMIIGFVIYGAVKNDSHKTVPEKQKEAVSELAANPEETADEGNNQLADATGIGEKIKQPAPDEGKAAPEKDGQGKEDAKTPETEKDAKADLTDKEPSKPALTPEGDEVPEEQIPEVFDEHEPEEVIVAFNAGYDANALTAAINASGCTVPQTINDEDMRFGFAKLTVNEDYDVEHAMVQLRLLPEISYAQPNFIYHQSDIEEDEELTEEQDADAEKESGEAQYTVAKEGTAEAQYTVAEAEPAVAEDIAGETEAKKITPEAVSVNDPDSAKQWMLDSVNAYEAWDLVKTEGSVTVAVLDNGFSLDHEDLDDNYLRDGNNNIVMFNSFDNTKEYVVENSHGTHVAGIIAAEANNGTGIAGVSYNAKILPVQVFNPLGKADTYDIIKGFDFVLKYNEEHPEANIHVINMSLGAGQNADKYRDNFDPDSTALDFLFFNYLNRGTENNILTVLASGNDADTRGGGYMNWPSDFADGTLNVISLEKGEYDEEPVRSSFSNYNRKNENTKNISAPGSDILSTSYSYKSYSNVYELMSGTSMAAPCVAGVAALVFAANPKLSSREVRTVILSTAKQIHSDTELYFDNFSEQYGYGELDAYAAVKLAQNMYNLRLTGDSELVNDTSVTLYPVNENGEIVEGNYTWISSDESIATVSDGVVTGVSGGNATITAVLGD